MDIIYRNKLWIEDIDYTSSKLLELSKLGGKSVLITGAAGLVCSSVVDIFFRYNDTHDDKIHIIAADFSKERIKKRFGNMIEREDFYYIPYDVSKSNNHLNFKADYIIHGASNANPALYTKEPVETMLGNIFGIKNLLDYSKEKGASRVLFISSSEVYGKKNNNSPFKEEDYGFVDILNPRNSYAMGKRAAETMCASYAKEYGLEFVVVRPGHIYGPTASEKDTRVSSAWAYDAANHRDIVMKSDGSQLRSYCYCLDCASAIIKVLISGEANKAYNISNPDSVISIKEMAEILANFAGVKLEKNVPTTDEIKSFNPMDNSSLDSKGLLDLGWSGCFNAKKGFEHTVEIIRDTNI